MSDFLTKKKFPSDSSHVERERVFQPDLRDVPVVVLSNNYGCGVAIQRGEGARHATL